MINDLKSSEKNIFHSLSLLSTAINSGDINGLMSSIGLTPDSAVRLFINIITLIELLF